MREREEKQIQTYLRKKCMKNLIKKVEQHQSCNAYHLRIDHRYHPGGLLFHRQPAFPFSEICSLGRSAALHPSWVFFLVMSALCHMGEGQKTNMKAIVILYCLGNLLAALVAVIAHYIFPVTVTFSENTATSDVAPPERRCRSADQPSDEPGGQSGECHRER